MAQTPEEKRAYQRAYYAANPDKWREYRRRKMAKPEYRERVKAANKAWADANREHKRSQTRLDNRRRKGCVDATDEHRAGPCEICNTHEDTLHFDHDHSTGLHRGWLCQLCNRGLGCFRDSTDALSAAVHYLRRATHGR